MNYAPRVAVCAAGLALYHTHGTDAARLVRDGLAERVSRVKVALVEREPGDGSSIHGNPQKYTFTESLGEDRACRTCEGDGKAHDGKRCPSCNGSGKVLIVDSHCQSLKLHVANPRNWPIFRAALLDCLPDDQREQIRKLFAERAA